HRVIESSVVRVGLSEIGYAFPAPTGIVDYDLRNPGYGARHSTLIAEAGPFGARGLSIDASLPLIGQQLQLPMGARYKISTKGAIPGYTQRTANFGLAPAWAPDDQLTFRAFFDWQQISHAKTLPVVLTAADFLPPRFVHRYLGQDWAENRSLSENYGGIVHAELSERWSLTAGVFRSILDSPVSYADLYADTQPSGRAEHFVVSNP